MLGKLLRALSGPDEAGARKRLVGELIAGRPESAFEALGPFGPKQQVRMLFEAARHLMLDDHHEAARQALERLLSLKPDHFEARQALSGLAAAGPDPEAGLEAARAFLAAHPRSVDAGCQLAALLIDAGRAEEGLAVLSPWTRAGDSQAMRLQAEALFALGRLEEALPVAAAVKEAKDAQMRSTLSRDEFEYAREQYEAAARLWDEINARLHGRETNVLAEARAGRLDAQAGENYRLVAESLMPGSDHTPTSLELLSTHDRRRAAEALGPGWSHAARGECFLREGNLDDAAILFAQARAAEPRCFAAVLGEGAVLIARRTGFPKNIEALPETTVPPGLPEIVPAWPALTALERRLVAASAHPLRAGLPALVAAGARAHLLPLDVRPTDLPDFAGFHGERTDDARTPAAIGGMATAHAFIVRLDELLDLGPESGLTFAHELAHTVLMNLPPAWRAAVEALHARALEVRYAFTQYQLENPDELWAVGYADWLGERWGLHAPHPRDDEGLRRRLYALFEALAATDALSEAPPA